jgi:hypothetical protein
VASTSLYGKVAARDRLRLPPLHLRSPVKGRSVSGPAPLFDACVGVCGAARDSFLSALRRQHGHSSYICSSWRTSFTFRALKPWDVLGTALGETRKRPKNTNDVLALLVPHAAALSLLCVHSPSSARVMWSPCVYHMSRAPTPISFLFAGRSPAPARARHQTIRGGSLPQSRAHITPHCSTHSRPPSGSCCSLACSRSLPRPAPRARARAHPRPRRACASRARPTDCRPTYARCSCRSQRPDAPAG